MVERVKELMYATFVTLVICAALYFSYQSGLDRVEYFPKTETGNIYKGVDYLCAESVLYRRGRTDTLMVDVNGKPIRCKNIQMTNREYNAL